MFAAGAERQRKPRQNAFLLLNIQLMPPQAAPLAPVINISLAADKPIMVGFALAEGNGSLRFFLAPKIEDDDIEAGEEESVIKRE